MRKFRYIPLKQFWDHWFKRKSINEDFHLELSLLKLRRDIYRTSKHYTFQFLFIGQPRSIQSRCLIGFDRHIGEPHLSPYIAIDFLFLRWQLDK